MWLFSHFWGFLRGIEKTATNLDCVDLNSTVKLNCNTFDQNLATSNTKTNSYASNILPLTKSISPSSKMSLKTTLSSEKLSINTSSTHTPTMISTTVKNDLSFSSDDLLDNLLPETFETNDVAEENFNLSSNFLFNNLSTLQNNDQQNLFSDKISGSESAQYFIIPKFNEKGVLPDTVQLKFVFFIFYLLC